MTVEENLRLGAYVVRDRAKTAMRSSASTIISRS